MSEELVALVHRVATADDSHAEQMLCAHFAPIVRLYARRHLGDAADADDVAQETLAIVLEQLRAGNLRDPNKVGQFVFGIARNKVRENRRAVLRRRRLDADHAPSASVEPVLVGFRMHLFFCLAQLTERARLVLERTYFAGEQSSEVADALALSIANVRVTRHRALGALRRCLEEERP